jgi:hypothetical protein
VLQACSLRCIYLDDRALPVNLQQGSSTGPNGCSPMENTADAIQAFN